VGDEVVAMSFGQTSNGSYAEWVCLPSSFVAKKPKALSFAQGASFPLVSLTAYRSLIAAPILQKGDTLFIAGAGGGVGSIAVELARYAGVSGIYTIARDEKSQQYLIENLEINPEHIVIYDGLKEDVLIQRILERNQGRPFDVSCDLVGNERKTLCINLTRYSGRFVTIVPENQGFSLPSWAIGSTTFAKNLTVHFSFVGAESYSGCPETAKIYAQQLTHITELIEKKILRTPAVTIAGPFSVQTVCHAHQLLEEGRVKGKLVMRIA
jgi:NADPH:quinone reductase-like Zn-dependent oxidoreductase